MGSTICTISIFQTFNLSNLIRASRNQLLIINFSIKKSNRGCKSKTDFNISASGCVLISRSMPMTNTDGPAPIRSCLKAFISSRHFRHRCLPGPAVAPRQFRRRHGSEGTMPRDKSVFEISHFLSEESKWFKLFDEIVDRWIQRPGLLTS